MNTTIESLTNGPVYWDPYRPDIAENPYPIYRRLREEAPLYYNEQYDFYALSKFTDIDRYFTAWEAFSSARSNILEFIKQGIEVPKGMMIWEDPPEHTVYRSIVSRVFTPKRMNDLEDKIRDYCARCLEPLVGADRFDFIADLGAKLPGGVIGMLLGIPDEDRDMVRERIDDSLRTEAGKPMTLSQASFQGEGFEEYVEWRSKNPSNDLMTELLNTEFRDETGIVRKLTREEVLIFVNVIAGAGNETTSRLIGWIGKLLGDHPEQRRQIAANRGLIPQAIEEILRYEPPSSQAARYVTRDIEIHGRMVPAGSVMLFLLPSANRDGERFPNGEQFDINRAPVPHLTFGRGIHSCLGAALARVEGRVALDEVLKRFPDWTVDTDNMQLSSSSTTRGWDSLPVFIGDGPVRTSAPCSAPTPTTATSEGAAVTPDSVAGEWNLSIKTPAGAMDGKLVLAHNGGVLSGIQSGDGSSNEITEARLEGSAISWHNQVIKPMKLKLQFSGEVKGDRMEGKVKTGFMGTFTFTGVKV